MSFIQIHLILLFVQVAQQVIPYTRLAPTQNFVSEPSAGLPLPPCPFCNISRCSSFPYCYTIKHGLRGKFVGEHCGTEEELAALVIDRLVTRLTNDACQPSVVDPQMAFCWCRNKTLGVTAEVDLRRIRIWRYTSLNWQVESERKSSLRAPYQRWYIVSTVIMYLFCIDFSDGFEFAVSFPYAGRPIGLHEYGLRRWSPLLLFLILLVYLLAGSSLLYYFENENHEHTTRKWFMNLAVNRRHFARTISSRIFNDTRNLLIIIDREQSERVQQLLVESLKRYEDRLEIEIPNKNDWSFLSCFNYVYSMLLTLGQGAKVPQTIGGQIFVLGFTVLGVPLFYGTIALCVSHLLAPFLHSTVKTISRRVLVLQLVLVLYVIWSLLLALFLYYQVFENFWTSVFTAFLGGMTLQVPHPEQISPFTFLVLLAACTVAVTLIVIALFLFLSAYITHGGVGTKKEDLPEQAQRFTIIVDEAGESKLQTEPQAL